MNGNRKRKCRHPVVHPDRQRRQRRDLRTDHPMIQNSYLPQSRSLSESGSPNSNRSDNAALGTITTMKQLNSLLFALFVCCGTVALCSSAEIKTDTPVTDEAAVLTAEQRKDISALLLAHNQKGPGRIFIIIVKQLPRETTMDKFALDTINKPPFKANEKADRILIAIAIQDRKMRIE